jgi:NADH dehydrogenase FAD-containing subunit
VPRVLIVGAGWAGAVAARELHDQLVCAQEVLGALERWEVA